MQKSKRLLSIPSADVPFGHLAKNIWLTVHPERVLSSPIPQSGQIVLIHQMGKVGSTTIHQSIKTLMPNDAIYHVHCMHPETLNWLWKNLTRIANEPIPRNLLASKALIRHIAANGVSGNRWKIITLTRDPIALLVSAFFQVGRVYLRDFYERAAREEISHQELQNTFLNEFPFHKWWMHWFDKEIKEVFDIDVLATPFPQSRGFQILRNGPVELLVMRLESLEKCGEEALNEFLGTSDLKLVSANIGDQKDYAELYNKFKRHLTLPESYIDEAYEHPWTRHFYNESETQAFRAKWQGHS